MSNTNGSVIEDIARQWFAHISHGEVDKALALCADDLKFINYKPIPGFNTGMPWIGTYIGKDAVKASFQVFASVATVRKEELLYLLTNEKMAAGIVHEISEIKNTGHEFEIEFVQLLTFENDKIIQWKSYTDPSPILQALE